MKDNNNKIIKIIQCLTVILLYYIANKNSMFLYATTLSLYNIYISCFSHITIKNTLKKIDYNYSKFKILKYITIIIISICLLFTITSILLSDTINIFLNIENTFLPYLVMSISVITEPLTKIFLEYLESYNKPKLSNSLLNTYYILETAFLLLIAILTVTVFKLPMHISVSLLYISKILCFILVNAVILIVLKKQNINFNKTPAENTIKYKKEIKEILKNNSHKSIINIVKNSYYYISIIILYMILSTRYSYNVIEIEKDITFIYLYGITLVNFIVDYIIDLIHTKDKKINIISIILTLFRFTLTVAIILGVTSPLICKIIFGDNSNSIYLMMLSFLSIFIALFNLTFESIKNKKIIYISLITGIIAKIILIVPLINSFYRMGYNLVYGDIISTIIGMSLSIIINYIYLKSKNKKEKTLDKMLATLYESIVLCIILVILQFIIPLKTDSYIKSIFLFGIYLFISITFLNIKKKRG